MQLSNFQLTKRFGTSYSTWSFRATVDVTTAAGFWRWKKKNTSAEQIYKNYAGAWFWSENGEYVAEREINALERAWEAHNECKIEDYVFPEAE